ncbi:MAG: hypothetical protein ACE5HI_08615, partial [bacterium]
MKLVVQKRNRIFLYFLLGIGLPCVLLSYFAFRGIQNDRALMEKQTQNQHRRIAQLIVDTTHDGLLEIEQACHKSLTLLPNKPDSNLIDSINRLKSQYALIAEVFLLDAAGNINLPTAQLLFVPDRYSLFHSLKQKPSSLIRKGQQYEYQAKAYDKALATYQRAFVLTTTQASKAAIMISIARVQQKLSHHKQAIVAYKNIIQKYHDIIGVGGIPVSLAAKLEIGSLYITMNDTLNAIQIYLDTLNELTHGTWLLNKSQYYFF